MPGPVPARRALPFLPLLASAAVLAACAPRALTRPALATDRPGYSDGPAVVARGEPLLEVGYTLTHDAAATGHAVGEVLLRAAAGPLADRLEWRLQLNSWDVIRAGGARVTGPEDLAVGAKVRLHGRGPTARAWEPDVSAIPRTTLPTGADGIGAGHAQPELKLVAAWPLGARAALTANTAWVHAVATRADGSAARTGRVLTTAIATYAATPRVTPFVEAMHLDAARRAEPAVVAVAAGTTLLWTSDVQLDLRAAVGASPAAPHRQLSAGVGRRF